MTILTKQEGDYKLLMVYTLGHPNREYFIHQHVVDAYHVQTATQESKPISVLFGLVGLYLFLEKNFTGKEVQRAHMKLAQLGKKTWVFPPFPENRGAVTVAHVLETTRGVLRDAQIWIWCESVWAAFAHWHSTIGKYAQDGLGLE